MSVLLDLSIFPVGEGSGLSRFVAQVVEMIDASGHAYQLTAMGTLVETGSVPEALAVIEQAYTILDQAGCGRVYATARFDIRPEAGGRLQGKVASVEARLHGQGGVSA